MTASKEKVAKLLEHPEPFEKLPAAERKDFTKLRNVARREYEKGRTAWQAMIAALREIHDRRLYREDFASFDDFCEAEFGYGENYGYKQIAAARVVSLCTDVQIEPPHCEAVARPLTRLSDDEVVTVWQRVQEAAEARGKRPTAADVEGSPELKSKSRARKKTKTAEGEPVTPPTIATLHRVSALATEIVALLDTIPPKNLNEDLRDAVGDELDDLLEPCFAAKEGLADVCASLEPEAVPA